MTDTLTETLDTLAEQADGTVGVNPDTGLIVYADAKVHELLDFMAGELVGEPLDVLLPQRVKNDHERWMVAFMVSHQPSQAMSDRTIAARRTDGTMIEANAVINAIDGTAVVFLFTPFARMTALRAQLDARRAA